MGNKSCTLGIQTEKSEYFSGDKVNGRVYLSINDPKGMVAHSVNIHCCGVERGMVHFTEAREKENDSGTYTEDRYEENEINILNFDVPVNTPLGSRYTRGQYEFPFQFVTPHNLPSTMFCKSGESKCEVRYELRAYIKKSSGGNPLMNPFKINTISSTPMPINIVGSHDNMHSLNQPITLPNETYNVRNCCCLYRGKMELRASLDSGHFAPNESHLVTFELKNNSRAHIENIAIEVIERVKWRPRFHEEVREVTLDKHVIEGCHQEEWSSTERRRNQTDPEYVSMSPTSRMGNSSRTVNVRVPPQARDTFGGRMIQVDHFIRVRVVTEGFCVSNPETTSDIQISRPSQNLSSTNDENPAAMPFPSAPFMDENCQEEQIVEATALPPDWSPLLSDVVTLPIASVVSASYQENQHSNSSQNQSIHAASTSFPIPSAPPKY
jgi:hypothetical protein